MMKKIFAICALMLMTGHSMAQEVTTSETTDDTQHYATKDELNLLLDEIKVKLDRVKRLETRLNLILQKIGSQTIEDYEEYMKFKGHDYVDLGLKDAEGNTIYWATCNVGAETPEDYGKYYAWGETKAYGEYDTSNPHLYQKGNNYFKYNCGWNTYKYCEDIEGYVINKYTIADGQTSCSWYKDGIFIGDNRSDLSPSDDAAAVNWGGAWRMPTAEEMNQLRNKCTWEWDENTLDGYKVTGPNGNSIYLPAAGILRQNDNDATSFCGYWTSTLEQGDSRGVEFLHINHGENILVFWGGCERCFGLPIRAVCK